MILRIKQSVLQMEYNLKTCYYFVLDWYMNDNIFIAEHF